MVRQSVHGRQMRLLSRGKILTSVVVLCASFTAAQSFTEIPVAPEPVGSGARALARSAFIAVADDATAAAWNPAGLVNLEKPEASFVGLWKTITNDVSGVTAGAIYNGDNWSLWEINFMSYARPIELGSSDVVLSVNYHQVYDLGLEYGSVDLGQPVNTRSKGAISAYSLAGGVSFPSRPEISLGASFNWHTKSLCNNYVRKVTTSDWVTGPSGLVEYEIEETLDDFRGYNFSFGVLWDVYEVRERLLTLGFVCHTPFTGEVDWRETRTPVGGSPAIHGPRQLEIDFPLSIGAGANYRFSDETSASLDVQWTNWSKYWYTEIGSPPADDTVAVRFGIEQLIPLRDGVQESVFAGRAGIFYEPRPAWSDILPVYGVSLGAGWTVKERFSLDFAYQYRWGEGDDFSVSGAGFEYGIEEHWFIASVVAYLR